MSRAGQEPVEMASGSYEKLAVQRRSKADTMKSLIRQVEEDPLELLEILKEDLLKG